MRNRAAIDRSYDDAVSSAVSVSVTQFVPDGVLTDANIDDAIDAAIAQAMENAGPDLNSYSYVVTVPAGIWTLSRTHTIPSFGTYRLAIGFRGAGRELTIFLVESDADASPVFVFGTYDATDLDHGFSMNGAYGGFSIIAKVPDGNCLRNGLVFYGVIQPIIRDIRVRGLYTPTARWDQGIGINIQPTNQDIGEQGSQFVEMRDIDVQGCTVGLYARMVDPLQIDASCSFQQCIVRNAVVDGALGYWRGGGAQFGAQSSSFTYGGRTTDPGTVSGWSLTDGLPSGTGATCGVAASGLCTVTGLSGLTGSQEQEAQYLELTPAGSTANENLVRGIYKIEQILSATSCTIRKGSNHTSQGSLAWQFRQSRDNYMTFEGLYDEGEDRPMFGLYSSENGGSEFHLVGNQWLASGVLVDARAIGKLTDYGNVDSGRSKLSAVSQYHSDKLFSKIEHDPSSYPGIRCGHNPFAIAGYSVTPPTGKDSSGGSQVRLTAMLKELGAVEIWDARVASSLSLTGSDVNSWTGLINGTVLTPPATKPTYDAADAGLDGPCVVIGTGTGGARSLLQGLIAAADLPSYHYGVTFVAVVRLPDTVGTTDRRIMGRIAPSGFYVQAFCLCDDTFAPGAFSSLTQHDHFPNGQSNVLFPGGTADTDPHVLVAGATGPASVTQEVSWETSVWGANGALAQRCAIPGADMEIGVGSYYGNDKSGAMRVALFAVIPHAASHAEHQKIVDLACNEWPLV